MARLTAGAWDRPVVTTTRRGEAGFRVVGVLLLVIPFLPVAAMFGPYADARGLFGPVDWVLGTGIFLTSTWLAGMLAPPRLLRAFRRRGAVARADPLLARYDRRGGRLCPADLRRGRGGGHGGALPPLALLPVHGRELHEPSADALLRVARPARLRPLGGDPRRPLAPPVGRRPRRRLPLPAGMCLRDRRGDGLLRAPRSRAQAPVGRCGARRRWLRSAGELAPRLQLGHHRRPLAPGIHQALGREPRPRFPRVTVGRAAHAVDGPRRSALEPEHAERVPVREPGPGL